MSALSSAGSLKPIRKLAETQEGAIRLSAGPANRTVCFASASENHPVPNRPIELDPGCPSFVKLKEGNFFCPSLSANNGEFCYGENF